MSIRYVHGNLAAEPETRQAGRVQFVTFTVLENTSHYRGQERVDGLAPLRHYVEASFELGERVLASLHKGDPVVVVGKERDASFNGKDGLVHRSIIDAQHVGPDLAYAAVSGVQRVKKAEDAATAAPTEEEPWSTPTASQGSVWEQAGAQG